MIGQQHHQNLSLYRYIESPSRMEGQGNIQETRQRSEQ